MKRSLDRITEATLANQRIPRAKLHDADAVNVLSIAITLRAARLGADQVDEEFVTRLRRRLTAELTEAPPTPKLSRRTMIVATGVAVAGLSGAVADRAIAPDRPISASERPGPEVVPNVGQWTAVVAESELTEGGIHRFTTPSAIGFLVNDDRSVWAVSGICTHQGCVLQLDRGARHLACPCHRATFSLNGTLISSEIRPAPGPLPLLVTRRRDGHIEVLLTKSDASDERTATESARSANGQEP